MPIIRKGRRQLRGCGEVNYLSRHGSPQGNRRGGAEEPNVHSWGGKRGFVTRHGDVTAGNQLTAGGGGQAVHHGDDGDRVVLDQHHDLKGQTQHVTSTHVSHYVTSPLSGHVPYASAHQVLEKGVKGGLKRATLALNINGEPDCTMWSP